nr:NAD(P)(+) transhydrogenase (Re/Si-specific) subunit beta [Cupriavidus gilardii]
MPTPDESIYLVACALAMGGLAAQAMGWRPGMACAMAGFLVAVLATLLAGREGVLLVAAAITLAGAVAGVSAWKGGGRRRWPG